MGIPSYFSYIVKNHSNIIKKLNKGKFTINNLYMDCNSIIYDSVRGIDFDSLENGANITIIRRVISKIEEYVCLIGPDNCVYIAFDGVAPVAKLEQQRNRRYKTWYQNEISKNIHKKPNVNVWNTTAITPGTEFMSQLHQEIDKYFSNPSLLQKFALNKIIVSTSIENGEGEHKLFNYIRENPDEHKDNCTIIYGLDADLIMLSINHLPICSRLFLFRETPEFIKTIDASLEPNETYLMDIPELANIITMNMNNNEPLTSYQQKNRIYDYIFLCFFLGNDFMPHFPAANIRTGGIDKLINAYKATIGGKNENLTDGKTIYWKNVRILVGFLAIQEEDFLRKEVKLRDKREKFFYPTETPEQRYTKFEAIPNYERELEKYVNPYKSGWQKRYYKSLLKMDNDEECLKQLSLNYLEGLEWTMKYYTTGCVDWRWHYMHNYPPLFQDLFNYIPYFEKEFIEPNNFKPVSPIVQLAYVLPKYSLEMLPFSKLTSKLIKEKSEWYPTDCEFTWAFCRYFWESHVELPEINIGELEEFIEDFLKKEV
jgi:5'-3' exonuclease